MSPQNRISRFPNTQASPYLQSKAVKDFEKLFSNAGTDGASVSGRELAPEIKKDLHATSDVLLDIDTLHLFVDESDLEGDFMVNINEITDKAKQPQKGKISLNETFCDLFQECIAFQKYEAADKLIEYALGMDLPIVNLKNNDGEGFVPILFQGLANAISNKSKTKYTQLADLPDLAQFFDNKEAKLEFAKLDESDLGTILFRFEDLIDINPLFKSAVTKFAEASKTNTQAHQRDKLKEAFLRSSDAMQPEAQATLKQFLADYGLDVLMTS